MNNTALYSRIHAFTHKRNILITRKLLGLPIGQPIGYVTRLLQGI